MLKVLVVVIVLVATLMMVSIYLTYHLAKYRVDIDPRKGPFEGRSTVWQVNVLRWSNYGTAGHRPLILLYAVLGLLLACIVTIVILLR